MKNEINILGFIEGNCSEAERNEVLAWINSAQENEVYFNHLKTLWENAVLPSDYIQFDTDLEWDAFKANPEVNFNEEIPVTQREEHRIFPEGRQSIDDAHIPDKRVNLQKSWPMIIVAIAAFFAALWFTLPPPQYIELIKIPSDTFLTLQDGTKISAYVGSTLTAPTSFQYKSVRIVEMEGNVFFEVANRDHQPFIVYTKNAGIEVMGTKFLILSDSLTTEVSNQNGHLLLFNRMDEDQNIELFTGDRIKFDGFNFIDLNAMEMSPDTSSIQQMDTIPNLDQSYDIANQKAIRLNDVLTYMRRIAKGRVKYGSGMNFKENPIVNIDYEGKSVVEIIHLLQEKGIVVYTTWCNGCYEIQEIIIRKE